MTAVPDDIEAAAEAHDNELVRGIPRWRWEQIGEKHAFDDGVIEDECWDVEPEDEEPTDELSD